MVKLPSMASRETFPVVVTGRQEGEEEQLTWDEDETGDTEANEAGMEENYEGLEDRDHMLLLTRECLGETVGALGNDQRRTGMIAWRWRATLRGKGPGD